MGRRGSPGEPVPPGCANPARPPAQHRLRGAGQVQGTAGIWGPLSGQEEFGVPCLVRRSLGFPVRSGGVSGPLSGQEEFGVSPCCQRGVKVADGLILIYPTSAPSICSSHSPSCGAAPPRSYCSQRLLFPPALPGTDRSGEQGRNFNGTVPERWHLPGVPWHRLCTPFCLPSVLGDIPWGHPWGDSSEGCSGSWEEVPV